jgi:hypothetical protein
MADAANDRPGQDAAEQAAEGDGGDGGTRRPGWCTGARQHIGHIGEHDAVADGDKGHRDDDGGDGKERRWPLRFTCHASPSRFSRRHLIPPGDVALSPERHEPEIIFRSGDAC